MTPLIRTTGAPGHTAPSSPATSSHPAHPEGSTA